MAFSWRLASVLLTIPFASQAEITGGDFMACIRTTNADSCNTYAGGVAVGLVGASFIVNNAPQNYPICPPRSGFSALQGAAIVSKYLQENPSLWNENLAILTAKALISSYPCR